MSTDGGERGVLGEREARVGEASGVAVVFVVDELPNKNLSDDGCDEDCDDDDDDKDKRERSPCNLPASYHRPQGPHPRRPFHPNFHPGDQRRFPPPLPPFDPRGPPFERGRPLERCHPPKFFNRPFHYTQRPPFPGPRRKPFRFFGRGGVYACGPSPYGGDGCPKRFRSEDEDPAAEDAMEEGEDDAEDGERPSQPIHTVLIDNEEYTKIQTPRQEVIFKKSSLDKKRDSLDLGSAPSTCGSTTGCDPSSQGDQGSVAGSVEDTNLSSSEEAQQENVVDHSPYEDTNNIFMGEPGEPPLAGIVMQQAYPGGPMISIPVHWTPFLDPGLIPGDTALTPLDPSFTHVIDPKDLLVDPAHILPVQHDSNGCPVTVQVRVDADGFPIEIEPGAFTVSLSTLQPHQQELLLRGSTDLFSDTRIQTSIANSTQMEKKNALKTEEELRRKEKEKETVEHPQNEENKKENLEKNESEHKDSEDSSSDSQYASMSEASTAPTTPSAEFSEPSDSSDSSKSRVSKLSVETSVGEEKRRISRSDSLLDDSASLETEAGDESCSSVSLNSASKNTQQSPIEDCHHTTDTHCVDTSLSSSTADEESHPLSDSRICSSLHSSLDESLTNPQCESVCYELSKHELGNHISIQNCDSLDSMHSSKKSDTNKKKNKKSKKSRSLSLESSISSQNSSLADINKVDDKTSIETLSKYQVKKSAKKTKREKKRLSKEKNRGKSSGNAVKNNNKVKKVCADESRVDLPTETESRDPTFLPEEKEKSEEPSEADNLQELIVQAPHPELEIESNDTESVHCEISKKEVIEVIDPQIPTESEGEIMTKNSEGSNRESIENTKNLETSKTNETEIEEGKTDESSPKQQQKEKKDNKNTSSKKEGEDYYVCKPGFVMVPVLTPYYDPAVLYGYPLVIPQNAHERNYSRKKKKKYKKKYEEDLCLDSDLYTGEPFIATSNNYIVPVEASQICHVHGYQYLPNVYPHIFPDKGFVSVEHSPYLAEFVPEPIYHRVNPYDESETYNKARFSKLHDRERKQIKEVLHEHIPKGDKKPKDFSESCDSGVSDSEELSHLARGKNSQEEGDREKNDSKETKKNKEKMKGTKTGNEKNQNEERGEKIKMKKETKKKSKNQKKDKSKKEIIEILEPDFSSFSGTTLRFESKEENGEAKQKSSKKPKNRKKKSKTQVQCEESDSPSLEMVNTVSESSISDTKASDLLTINKESDLISNSETKSKKIKAKIRFESQTETLKNVKNQNETKGNRETATTKKPRGSRRKHKALNRGGKDVNGDIKNKDKKSSPSTATECLVYGSFVDQLSEEDCLTQESENGTASEDCLSQESENATASENCLSQESENVTASEDCLRQESETVTESEDCLSRESENALTNEESSSQESGITAVSEERLSLKTSTFSRSKATVLKSENVLHNLNEKEPISSEWKKMPDSSSVQILSSIPAANGEFRSQSPFSFRGDNESSPSPFSEESTSATLTPEEHSEKCASSLPDDEESTRSFKDLGVTEAVRRWIREVTPEKAFALSDETRSLFLSSVITSSDNADKDCEVKIDDVTIDETSCIKRHPKNVQGNPSVASPSEDSLGAGSERVAPLMFLYTMTSQSGTTPTEKLRFRTSSSQDVFDEYDGESVISGLSRGRLYSSSSSSSFPLACHLEDATLIEDPRVYDPTVYSKYYQLSADAQATLSNTSTRESTLSPSPVESGFEDVEPFPEEQPQTPTDLHSMCLAAELYKSEKIRTNMTHISPSLCEDSLPMPYCGYSAPFLGDEGAHRAWAGAESYDGNDPVVMETSISQKDDPPCSVSSSGIGSSLASTPNVSPSHKPYPSTGNTNPRPKLEPHPLKNLSVGEGPLPCRAVCCSVM